MPWEPAHRTPFLSPAEEREALISEVTTLPRRHFYLWNRNVSPAELVVADSVEVPNVRLREGLRRRIRDGVLAVPVRDLEAELAAHEAELVPAEPAAHTVVLPLRTRAPRRRTP